MKTKDFIKMLQEEDPTGEGYVRLPDGGAPWFAERKEGYWDGAYQYLENIDNDDNIHNPNKRIIISTKGYKIDIHTLSIDDMIWDEDGNMEKIRKRIKVDTEYHNDNERSKQFWKHIEEDAKDAKEYDDEFLYKRGYDNVIDNFYYDKTSWEVRQPLDTKIGDYHMMKAFALFRKSTRLNQGQCDVLIRSGYFYPEKKKKYYVWKHDPDKGKDWSIK